MNTKTKHSQWRAPAEFDGTFVLCDDDTGFIASTRLQADVTGESVEPAVAPPQTPPSASNVPIQRRLSAASVVVESVAT
jgi:hypothetical protein